MYTEVFFLLFSHTLLVVFLGAFAVQTRQFLLTLDTFVIIF